MAERVRVLSINKGHTLCFSFVISGIIHICSKKINVHVTLIFLFHKDLSPSWRNSSATCQHMPTCLAVYIY